MINTANNVNNANNVNTQEVELTSSVAMLSKRCSGTFQYRKNRSMYMYTNEDFKTKKALKEAVNSGKKIGIYQPGPFPVNTQNGTFVVEGPHYPKPHSWYARVTVQEGWIRSVK